MPLQWLVMLLGLALVLQVTGIRWKRDIYNADIVRVDMDNTGAPYFLNIQGGVCPECGDEIIINGDLAPEIFKGVSLISIRDMGFFPTLCDVPTFIGKEAYMRDGQDPILMEEGHAYLVRKTALTASILYVDSLEVGGGWNAMVYTKYPISPYSSVGPMCRPVVETVGFSSTTVSPLQLDIRGQYLGSHPSKIKVVLGDVLFCSNVTVVSPQVWVTASCNTSHYVNTAIRLPVNYFVGEKEAEGNFSVDFFAQVSTAITLEQLLNKYLEGLYEGQVQSDSKWLRTADLYTKEFSLFRMAQHRPRVRSSIAEFRVAVTQLHPMMVLAAASDLLGIPKEKLLQLRITLGGEEYYWKATGETESGEVTYQLAFVSTLM